MNQTTGQIHQNPGERHMQWTSGLSVHTFLQLNLGAGVTLQLQTSFRKGLEAALNVNKDIEQGHNAKAQAPAPTDTRKPMFTMWRVTASAPFIDFQTCKQTRQWLQNNHIQHMASTNQIENRFYSYTVYPNKWTLQVCKSWNAQEHQYS